MRIVAISPTYPPRVGGGEKYAHRINTELAARGNSVHVVTAVAGAKGSTSTDGVTIDYINARRFIGFPWFRPAILKQALADRRAEVLLAYGPSPYDPIAALIARSARVPFVQVYHADFDRRRIATQLATRLHNPVALRIARTIVCTNDAMANALGDRGFSGKIAVVPGGVDAQFFAAPLERTQDLLFVGALDDGHRYKRLDLLLEAIAAMRRADPDVRLNVAGDGNRRAAFESAAAQLGLADCVAFLGSVPDAELAERYRRSSALVLPSPTAQEGFGLVCLEAIASGLPVVCSANAGAANIVAQAPGCAVWNGRDLESLTTAIFAARGAGAAQRQELHAFGARFSWSAAANQMMRALQA